MAADIVRVIKAILLEGPVPGEELMDKVIILCPIAESVNPRVFESILAAVAYACQNGVRIEHIGVSERELIDKARNRLAEGALQTDSEWQFWVDADQVIPPNTITELLKVAKEKEAKIVTGIYYQRKNRNLPVLFARGDELENGERAAENSLTKDNKYLGVFTFPGPGQKDPFKVHAAGFGCALVHRDVFELLDKPYFKFVEDVCSEDFYFFVNAKEKGFQTWAVPSLKIGHLADPPIITVDDFMRKAKEDNLVVEAIKKENN